VANEFADDQWGLVTRAQALAADMPRPTFARLVAAGALIRVAHGVYRVAGSANPAFLELRAAWLQLDPELPAWQRVSAGDGAVISHRSAAEIYELGDLIADVHEFSVPARKQTRREDVRLHIRQISDSDRAVVAGLPVTRPHRIVADLLAVHEDGSAVAAIAGEAVERGLVTPATLATAVTPLAARYRVPDGETLVGRLLSRAA
jgi:hypothetical protein